MTDQDHLDRINALTSNARSTWFALLAALVFVGITLMGVEHIDFYGVDRATTLPLVSFEVPTRYFFVAAPILIAAIYGYFHLYLIRLWDALGAAPARLSGVRLGDAIAPWLVADAALDYRARKRKDNCTTPRTLEGPAALLNLLLAWGFGLIVLAALWWFSLPARTFWMAAIAATSFIISLFTAFASLETLFRRLRTSNHARTIHAFKRWTDYPLLAVALAGTVYATRAVTEGPPEWLAPLKLSASYAIAEEPADWLAPLDLSGENIVERPAGWLSYQDAKAEFRAAWCRREFIDDCSDLGDRESAFADEFTRRRSAAIGDLRKPDWHEPFPVQTNMDFRNANMEGAFLAGVNLSKAQMQNAYLNGAQLEGVYLDGAQLRGATLSFAEMAGAVLSGAQLQGAVMSVTQLQGATMIAAQMEWANLSEAQMEGANLSQAQMEGADLSGAQMEGADFRLAQMQRADLDRAQLQGADLEGAQMERAYLRDAQLTGANLLGAQLMGADLNGAQMNGADLYYAQLDGSVLLRAQMEGADLYGAQMKDTALDYSRIFGSREQTIQLVETDLSGSTNVGGALRFVDMLRARFNEKTDFRNAFLDGSVTMTPEFRAQMESPCHWASEVLNDVAFFGRWRGWIEAAPPSVASVTWGPIAPEKYEDIPAIPPPPGCEWKTGAMPGAE